MTDIDEQIAKDTKAVARMMGVCPKPIEMDGAKFWLTVKNKDVHGRDIEALDIESNIPRDKWIKDNKMWNTAMSYYFRSTVGYQGYMRATCLPMGEPGTSLGVYRPKLKEIADYAGKKLSVGNLFNASQEGKDLLSKLKKDIKLRFKLLATGRFVDIERMNALGIYSNLKEAGILEDFATKRIAKIKEKLDKKEDLKNYQPTPSILAEDMGRVVKGVRGAIKKVKDR